MVNTCCLQGTNYQKVQPQREMHNKKREEFWEKQQVCSFVLYFVLKMFSASLNSIPEAIDIKRPELSNNNCQIK